MSADQNAESDAALRRAIVSKMLTRTKDDTYNQGWNDALCLVLDLLSEVRQSDGQDAPVSDAGTMEP